MHIYTAAMTTYEAIGVATAETVIQLVTPSTRRARILEVSIGIKSVTSTDVAALVQLVRQSTAGTTGATITPRPHDDADPASLCTANITFSSTEPTTSAIIKAWNVIVQSSIMVFNVSGDCIQMPISGRLALTINSPQAQNVIASITWQE